MGDECGIEWKIVSVQCTASVDDLNIQFFLYQMTLSCDYIEGKNFGWMYVCLVWKVGGVCNRILGGQSGQLFGTKK